MTGSKIDFEPQISFSPHRVCHEPLHGTRPYCIVAPASSDKQGTRKTKYRIKCKFKAPRNVVPWRSDYCGGARGTHLAEIETGRCTNYNRLASPPGGSRAIYGHAGTLSAPNELRLVGPHQTFVGLTQQLDRGLPTLLFNGI